MDGFGRVSGSDVNRLDGWKCKSVIDILVRACWMEMQELN